MHGPYLHGRTYTQQYGPKDDKIKVERKERASKCSAKASAASISTGWRSFTATAVIMLVRDPAAALGRAGWLHGDHLLCDPHRRSSYADQRLRLRKVSGWQRDLWHFLFHYRLRGFVDAVLAQDKAAMDAMPPWPAPENLYQHDIGVVRMRRHVREVATSQARALFAEPG